MNKIQLQQLKEFSQKIKVLYVEDNKDSRGQTLKMLDNFFVNVTSAIDGLDGLDKFKQDKYDLVITDINMPNKNGIEMIRDIKEIDEDIFCLIISAHNETDYFIEAIELGVDGFLMKPIKIEQFSNLLFKMIEQIKNAKEVKDIAIRQEKLALMGEMIDTIAHQWKQPLGIIQLKLQMLNVSLKANSLTDDMIKSTVKVSEEQIKHLVNTMAEFRAFFRPDTQTQTVVLKSIIDLSLLLVKDVLIKNMIDIKINGDLTATININANEFKHIIINLINNSKDAFNENNIKDTTKQITFNIKSLGQTTELIICDNAGGVPQDTLEHIFKSNFTTKEKDKGTGMGLYLVKQIVDKYNGTIEAFNENDGVCFKILLNTN